MRKLLVVAAMLLVGCFAGCESKTVTVEISKTRESPVEAKAAEAAVEVYVDASASFTWGTSCFHKGRHKYACGACGDSATVNQFRQNNLTGAGNWGHPVAPTPLYCLKCFNAGKGTTKMAYLGVVYAYCDNCRPSDRDGEKERSGYE